MTCYPEEQPEHQSTVSTFALDKYEVTVARFRNFVAAYEAGWRPAVGSGKNSNVTVGDTSWRAGWDDSGGSGLQLPKPGAFTDTAHLRWNQPYSTWTDSPGTPAQESRPITCVDWYEAFAFCIWDGGRLATESEWEYAAVGGAENRLYPWGSATPDCTYANFYMASVYAFCGPGGAQAVAPVGSYAAGSGKWGHADLAGNVDEWIFDCWGGYTSSPSDNYADTTDSDSHRIYRGSAFEYRPEFLRPAFRGNYPPTSREHVKGFRCARSQQ